eukprot:CAMPEP_0168605198 /NCGR_PEP_ID=MMETSP0420-20121227/15797_1 /TAXON_ID=498008 /ORGANISM="Pessonella sp." /LENGTH=76 /DNA_ID=CAMNT_0008644555 /DNA_START=26 /DNA_END=256 /DNA_ORIENTATION=+
MSSCGSTRSPSLRTSAASVRPAMTRRSSLPVERFDTTTASMVGTTSLSVFGVFETSDFHAAIAASVTCGCTSARIT